MNITTWTETDNALFKTFEFPSFMEAMQWMLQCTPAIDALNHHPEWTNVYNKVHVKLCTHDAGNSITNLDYQLAEMLDNLYPF